MNENVSLVDLKGMVDRHDQDLYRGDSRKPGLTTRVEVVEDFMEGIRNNLSRIVYLLLGILLTFMADIILQKVHW